VIYKTRCTVIKVEERSRLRHVKGIGDAAEFVEESTGWWAVVSGNLAIPLGPEKPDAKPGQTAMIILDLSIPSITLAPLDVEV
jgi:hypothetical protein